MKKKLSAVLMTLGAVSMLCGFDSAETADSIMQKQQEAVTAVSSTDADISVNADVAINFAGAALTATANGKIDAEVLMAEPAMKLEGSIDVLSPLLGQENTYDFKMYLKTNESGTPDVYVYYGDMVSGDSFWDHETGNGIDMNGLLDTASTVDMNTLSALGISFTLTPEAVDVDGTECYELSTVIDSETFSTVLDKASSLTGQDLSADESVALAMELLTGLKINMAYYIDTESYLPVKMHMDMNDSDLTAIEMLASAYMTSMMGDEEELTLDIILNDLSMDVATAYNTVTEIVVPDEALYAGYSTDIIPDNMEADLGSAVDSINDAIGQ